MVGTIHTPMLAVFEVLSGSRTQKDTRAASGENEIVRTDGFVSSRMLPCVRL